MSACSRLVLRGGLTARSQAKIPNNSKMLGQTTKQEVSVVFERKTKRFSKNITSVGVESHLSRLARVTTCPSQMHKLTPDTCCCGCFCCSPQKRLRSVHLSAAIPTIRPRRDVWVAQKGTISGQEKGEKETGRKKKRKNTEHC